MSANVQDFTAEQKRYLEGFFRGSDLARTRQGLPSFATLFPAPAAAAAAPPTEPSAAASGPEEIHRAAQDRVLAAGGKLCPEEMAKRERPPLDAWDEIIAHAEAGRFPKGLDVFRFKFHGLFYVAPAQDSYMCRLRFPGGILSSHQARGVAALAESHGGGTVDVTTRANLQIREIRARSAAEVLMGLAELGIINRGAGADNVRNVTASPTAGIDPQELIDTRPLARAMHHHILQHRELYGLPRKFNIAFDGGGAISALEDTNDIGFAAVRVGKGQDAPPGVYFRLLLGGITGHRDFARDSGVLLEPAQCLPVAAAALRVFIEHGDRTDRKKARLKYVLDRWGHEKFVAELERLLPAPLRRLPLAACEARPAPQKHGHIGIHRQRQDGLYYAGLVLPVGRMTSAQLRGLAALAERFGSGTLRLTVWQNLLISDIPSAQLPELCRGIEALGLDWRASNVRSALVACTGSRGCKYAAADTKGHALGLADRLEARLELDSPINIHFTGCHHSCAQHYVGDLGLLATKVPAGEELVEGYHVYVGGGYGGDRAIARELWRDVVASELPERIESLLRAYLAERRAQDESFNGFSRRQSIEALRELCQRHRAPSPPPVAPAAPVGGLAS